MQGDEVNTVDSSGESAGMQARTVERHVFLAGRAAVVVDQIAEETPVALVYNGISHAVMMATARDLDDFALGFSLSESIIDDVAEVYDIESHTNPDVHGIEIQIRISSGRFAALKERRRNLAGNTGCGLCGKENLQALQMQMPTVATSGMPFDRLSKASLLKAAQSLNDRQAINLQTGAVHAAGWVDMAGDIQIVREDVGRHNALDKLLGAVASRKISTSHGFVLISSRLSYELVQKTARANIAILAAFSAPTTLAIDLATQTGICLIGFVREHGFVVYSHPERLLAE